MDGEHSSERGQQVRIKIRDEAIAGAPRLRGGPLGPLRITGYLQAADKQIPRDLNVLTFGGWNWVYTFYHWKT